MNYFLLTQSVTSPIKIQGIVSEAEQTLPAKEKYSRLKTLSVGYTPYQKHQEIPDLLLHPLCLVSDAMKRLISVYEETIDWKGIQVYPQDEALIKEVSRLYWAGDYPEQECLHEDTVRHPNQMIKELVLDRRKMRNMSIFRIGGILENRIVISEDLAESMLRRRFYGVGIEAIQIKETNFRME